MDEWISVIVKQLVVVCVSSLCAYLGAELKQKKRELARQEERAKLFSMAVISILRNTIHHVCEKRIEQGWVTIEEQSNINACHDIYEKIIKFEGMTNGETDNYMAKFKALPNVPPHKK